MERLNYMPTNITIEAQRDVELGLLHFIKKYNPDVYTLLRDHPLLAAEGDILDPYGDHDDDDDGSSSSSSDDDGNGTGIGSNSNSNARTAETDEERQRRTGVPDFSASVPLMRRLHGEYLSRQLGTLDSASQGLYPSRPWLAYWALQAADVLGITTRLLDSSSSSSSSSHSSVSAEGLVAVLMSCLVLDNGEPSHTLRHDRGENKATHEQEIEEKNYKNGNEKEEEVVSGNSGGGVARGPRRRRPVIGFAGGPSGQMAHMISTYAAVAALCLLHPHHPCLRTLPRAAIKRWLLSLRTQEGGFRVHPGGECDIRASYAAAVVTSLLRLDEPETFPRGGCGGGNDGALANLYERLGITAENGFHVINNVDGDVDSDVRDMPVLTRATALFVARQQTHEGGFTCGQFATEAHGAYTQCGLAALLIMKQPHLVRSPPLRRWLCERQLVFEGGFSGRTNKLVDSCYSHWVGSSHVMMAAAESYSRLLGCSLRTRVVAEENSNKKNINDNTPEEEEAATSQQQQQQHQGEFMLAKELFLLDHVQLLDLTMAVCSDTDGWDRAETRELTTRDLVDRFLSADDAARRQETQRRGSRAELFRQLQRQNYRFDRLSKHNKNGSNGDTPEEADAEFTATELPRMQQDTTFALPTTTTTTTAAVGDALYNQRKLQQYILRCCQSWQDGEGGLMDKPECNNDSYHTCYSLSGMSTSQNLQYIAHAGNVDKCDYIRRAMEEMHYVPGKREGYGVVIGVESGAAAEVSMLRSTNPIFNVNRSRVVSALSTWGVKKFL